MIFKEWLGMVYKKLVNHSELNYEMENDLSWLLLFKNTRKRLIKQVAMRYKIDKNLIFWGGKDWTRNTSIISSFFIRISPQWLLKRLTNHQISWWMSYFFELFFFFKKTNLWLQNLMDNNFFFIQNFKEEFVHESHHSFQSDGGICKRPDFSPHLSCLQVSFPIK